MKREITLGQVITVAATIVVSLITGWITMNNKVSSHEVKIQTLETRMNKTEVVLDRIEAKVERILIALEQKVNR